MKPEAERRQIGVTLDRRYYAKLEAVAEQEGRTKTAVCRRAIEKYLDGEQQLLVSPGRPWELDDD